ncbi:hypothetical protein HKBW3S09_01806, partial [Candidatus Hakubella thermalkaliphila]
AHAPRRTTSHENWVIFKGGDFGQLGSPLFSDTSLSVELEGVLQLPTSYTLNEKFSCHIGLLKMFLVSNFPFASKC